MLIPNVLVLECGHSRSKWLRAIGRLWNLSGWASQGVQGQGVGRGMPSKRIGGCPSFPFSPYFLSATFWSATHSWPCNCLTTDPEQQEQWTMAWDLQNWHPKQTFSFLFVRWFILDICFSNGKLTNTLSEWTKTYSPSSFCPPDLPWSWVPPHSLGKFFHSFQ
jgi:hypothetical protein